jgi:hypothetical protein
MHYDVGQGFGAVQVEQRVDVIGDVIHLKQMALLCLEDTLCACVQGGIGSLGQQGGAVFGAEDEVDEDLRERLGNDAFTLICRRSAARFQRAKSLSLS